MPSTQQQWPAAIQVQSAAQAEVQRCQRRRKKSISIVARGWAMHGCGQTAPCAPPAVGRRPLWKRSPLLPPHLRLSFDQPASHAFVNGSRTSVVGRLAAPAGRAVRADRTALCPLVCRHRPARDSAKIRHPRPSKGCSTRQSLQGRRHWALPPAAAHTAGSFVRSIMGVCRCMLKALSGHLEPPIIRIQLLRLALDSHHPQASKVALLPPSPSPPFSVQSAELAVAHSRSPREAMADSRPPPPFISARWPGRLLPPPQKLELPPGEIGCVLAELFLASS